MAETLPFDPIEEAAHHWARHWGEPTAAPMAATTSIMRTQQILMARLNETVAPFSLTFPRYEALMLLFLSRTGSLPLGKMGARLQVHRTSVTNLVDGLERAELARREPHPSDRRTTLAVITPAGRTAAEGATTALNEARFGLQPLADGQLATLIDLLGALRAAAGDFG